MIVTSMVTLPDGRAFELSLEPKFDRTGYKVVNFVLHAIDEQPQPITGSERALKALDTP